LTLIFARKIEDEWLKRWRKVTVETELKSPILSQLSDFVEPISVVTSSPRELNSPESGFGENSNRHPNSFALNARCRNKNLLMVKAAHVTN
jgi:hypothetical protein